MRLVLYHRNFPPYGERARSGIAKAVHGLACGLVRGGARVTVLRQGRSRPVDRAAASAYAIRSVTRWELVHSLFGAPENLKYFLVGHSIYENYGTNYDVPSWVALSM